MKKTLLLTLACSLLLASCSVFSKLSEIDYNNTVVEKINEVSTAIEESATLYNETVPDLVTESSTIDTVNMSSSYDAALLSLGEIADLLLLESRNVEQQNNVKSELQTYQTAGTEYLETYQEMLSYYQTGAFTEDVSKVQTLDEELHTSYTTFIQANNDLVDILESYVSSK